MRSPDSFTRPDVVGHVFQRRTLLVRENVSLFHRNGEIEPAPFGENHPLSLDLPLVIEIVDSEEKNTGFLQAIEGMVAGGLVTVEEVRVVTYSSKPTGDNA